MSFIMRCIMAIGLLSACVVAYGQAMDLPYADIWNHLSLCNITLVSELANQVPQAWSPLTVDELKARAQLTALTNRDYEGQIANPGDRVHITQFQVGTADRRAIGSGHEQFSPQQLNSARKSLIVDQVIDHVIELDDLVPLQTQLTNPESELRIKMETELALKMDAYLFSLVSASTSSPDHLLGGVTDFNATAIGNCRKLAAKAKWSKTEPWYTLLDPQYYQDLLGTSTMVSNDYVDEKTPTVAGQFVQQRWGFNILENNDDNFLSLDTGAAATQDVGLSFVPSFMHSVYGNVEWFLTDNRPAGKYTAYLGVRVLAGAVIGHDHASKCIVTRGTS
jgi:hypothetical protein